MRKVSHPDNGLFSTDLDANDANYAPLSPLSFLERTASLHPDLTAVIGDTRTMTYRQFDARCRRLASGLVSRGVLPGDCVAVLAPNCPAVLEAHFGVPMMGGVLNTINTRLDADTIAYILGHGQAKLLLVDSSLVEVARVAMASMSKAPEMFVIHEGGPDTEGAVADYEDIIAAGHSDTDYAYPADEWQAISLNYTSGTTGRPKGVVYHQRGAWLNATCNAVTWSMPKHPVYLWTLPMFHCNGWCFPWTVTLQAGVHVCLRQVSAASIQEAIDRHNVTHMCGAPVIMGMVIEGNIRAPQSSGEPVAFMTAAAPPPAATLEKMEGLGFEVTHVYGLTETYGPAVVCARQPGWEDLPVTERASLMARQGVAYEAQQAVSVRDPETLEPIAHDAETMGEIMFSGNIVMKGYLADPEATAKAFAGGYFHSGDLAVTHGDQYLEIRDRAKDIIISGGENISSIEVEGALYRHPDVVDAAVVAMPHDKWGETPCAFVSVRAGASVTERELIDHCRELIAHYMCPRKVVFGDLPKTSTGKVQKVVLRERAKTMSI